MALDQLPVPALGLAASGGDDLEAVRARLEAAGHFWTYEDCAVVLVDYQKKMFEVIANRDLPHQRDDHRSERRLRPRNRGW